MDGKPDEPTRMEVIQNLEFLQTQIEGIMDTSGSMAGDRAVFCVEAMVIIVEAFKEVLKRLREENLLEPDEQPFQIGATKFSIGSERISKLNEQLSDTKVLKIIDKFSHIAGGTDEAEAMKEVYQPLALGQDNVIKIMVMMSDGDGNRAAVHPLMQQIEADGKVVFLVIAFGNKSGQDGASIAATYLKPIKAPEEGNIHALVGDDFIKLIPELCEFFKREIGKRRRR
jgi:hypothetical protein